MPSPNDSPVLIAQPMTVLVSSVWSSVPFVSLSIRSAKCACGPVCVVKIQLQSSAIAAGFELRTQMFDWMST